MTLKEAIEILTTHTKEPCTVSFDDLKEAELLLIEAGKLQEKMRAEGCTFFTALLPGETKD